MWLEKKSVSLKTGPKKKFTLKSRERIVIWKLGLEKNCDLKTGDRKNISNPNSEIHNYFPEKVTQDQ